MPFQLQTFLSLLNGSITPKRSGLVYVTRNFLKIDFSTRPTVSRNPAPSWPWRARLLTEFVQIAKFENNPRNNSRPSLSPVVQLRFSTFRYGEFRSRLHWTRARHVRLPACRERLSCPYWRRSSSISSGSGWFWRISSFAPNRSSLRDGRPVRSSERCSPARSCYSSSSPRSGGMSATGEAVSRFSSCVRSFPPARWSPTALRTMSFGYS